MHKDEKKDLLEKWQILGLSLMMISKSQEDFYDLVQQEFGYVWDGKVGQRGEATNEKFIS